MSYPWNSFDTLTAADLNAAIGMAASSGTTVAGGTNNVGRNLIHNSMMNIAQRGTSGFTTLNSYTLDRWWLSGVTDTCTVIQSAVGDAGRAAIGDEEANFALQNTFTGNAAAGAFNRIEQRTENVRRLAGKTVTISFWAIAAAGTPKLGINMAQNFGTGGSPSPTVTVLPTGNALTLSTAWTRYSTTITLPSISGKTLGTAGNDYTSVQIYCSAGANTNASAGNIGVQGPNVVVNIWGVQLEVGTVATPLEKRDPVTELQQCQRFYCIGGGTDGWYSGVNSGFLYATGTYPVTMRAVPATLTVTPTGGVGYSSVTTSSVTASGFVRVAAVNATGSVNYNWTFTASADL